MAETFKAVEGFAVETSLESYTNHTNALRNTTVFNKDIDGDFIPCTIIPGHWAERIESGELLTVGEYNALKKEYRTAVIESSGELTTKWDVYLIQHIARKLRGGA